MLSQANAWRVRTGMLPHFASRGSVLAPCVRRDQSAFHARTRSVREPCVDPFSPRAVRGPVQSASRAWTRSVREPCAGRVQPASRARDAFSPRAVRGTGDLRSSRARLTNFEQRSMPKTAAHERREVVHTLRSNRAPGLAMTESPWHAPTCASVEIGAGPLCERQILRGSRAGALSCARWRRSFAKAAQVPSPAREGRATGGLRVRCSRRDGPPGDGPRPREPRPGWRRTRIGSRPSRRGTSPG